MQPVTADLGSLEGRAIPYHWATPGQKAQAILWLAQQLHHHFLPPPMEIWSQVFHEYQPELWEDQTGICLDHADLVRLAQRVAHSLLAPDLDPPIYCEAAHYLAEVQTHHSLVAADLRTELEASPVAHNTRLLTLIETLANGNAIAERVLSSRKR